jgi:hypothetical protein
MQLVKSAVCASIHVNDRYPTYRKRGEDDGFELTVVVLVILFCFSDVACRISSLEPLVTSMYVPG